MKEASTSARGVCKNGEMIFIAGGHGGPGWLNSCEVYNIATNEWQFIASLTMPRVSGKMVLIDGTIYVLGGKVQKSFKDPCDVPDGMVTVEYCDEERDIWNDRIAMPIEKLSLWEDVEIQ